MRVKKKCLSKEGVPRQILGTASAKNKECLIKEGGVPKQRRSAWTKKGVVVVFEQRNERRRSAWTKKEECLNKERKVPGTRR